MRSVILVALLLLAATAVRAEAPRPLPAVMQVHVHLPGAHANRHLHVQVDLGRGQDWFIEGCLTDAGGVCTRTRGVRLTAAERVRYVQLWGELRAIPRCEPEAVAPGDRPFELSSSQGRYEGHLPARVNEIAARHQGPCRAAARMAWWVAGLFQSR